MNTEAMIEEDVEPTDLYERHKIVSEKGQQPLRIDKFLVNRIENATRNKIQQAIKNGLVTVDGQTIKANYKLQGAKEILVLSDTLPEATDIVPEAMPLDIEFEDEQLLVINKRAGMVVHPGCGNYTGTLINGVAFYLLHTLKLASIQDLPRFGLVHRIDKNTSGLLVLAKHAEAARFLINQFAAHTCQRAYTALVWGNVQNETGTIHSHIGRHKRFRKIFDTYPEGDVGKEAITHYRVLERFNYTTLLECRLETGRTHQIRVHMQSIGHPLFNDDTYGGNQIVKGTPHAKYKQFVENCFAICTRQALHAKTLGFVHPQTHEFVCFNSPLPKDMQTVIDKWAAYSASVS